MLRQDSNPARAAPLLQALQATSLGLVATLGWLQLQGDLVSGVPSSTGKRQVGEALTCGEGICGFRAPIAITTGQRQKGAHDVTRTTAVCTRWCSVVLVPHPAL